MLPKGTLIAEYWDTYVISSVAYKNITPLTFDDQMVRNAFMKKKAMKNKYFYFINNEELKKYAFKDTIKQFNRVFVFTGQKYNCNNQEVLCYRKL